MPLPPFKCHFEILAMILIGKLTFYLPPPGANHDGVGHDTSPTASV